MEDRLGSFSQVSTMRYPQAPAQALAEAAARLRSAVTLGPNDNSHSLVIRNAPIQYLPDAVNQFTHLRQIHLEDCDLRALPEHLGNLNQLQQLNLLYHPNLRRLPDSLNNLVELQKLDVRDTKITELPQINRLSQLKTLSVDSTPLTAMPSDIAALRNLKRLIVTRTNIREIPPTIGNLMQLKILTLSRSRHLQAVPASIGNLSGLEELALNGCRELRAVPDSIGNLRQLKKLYLHDCPQLRTLPESIANLMPHLTRLDLNGCTSLQRLPECLRNPPRHLHLTLPPHLRQQNTASSSGTPTAASPDGGASPLRDRQPAAAPVAEAFAGFQPHLEPAPAAAGSATSRPDPAWQPKLASLEAQGGDAARVAQWLKRTITNTYDLFSWNLPPAFHERAAELVAAVTASGPHTVALHAAIVQELGQRASTSLAQIERVHLRHRQQTEHLDWKDFIALAVQQASRSTPDDPAGALRTWPALRDYAREHDPLVKMLTADIERANEALTDMMLNSQTDLRASSDRTRVLGEQLKHANDTRLPREYARVAKEWVNGRPSSSAMQEALGNLAGTLTPEEFARLARAATALPVKLQDALSPLLAHQTGREMVQVIGERSSGVEVPRNLPSQLDDLAKKIDRGIRQIRRLMAEDKSSTAELKGAGFAMSIPLTVQPLWEATLSNAKALDVAQDVAAEHDRVAREERQRNRWH
ncbi:leucine-rich repeat domain-containing protein [Ralstonia pseudosolanacearum]|uniref:leucine-rich repeat domain-containing protein n=2 Tax=Ralstonia pseudosolanacearum TaxID=1310165 RepID=UPI003CEF9716